jgi:hypothetical protein
VSGASASIQLSLGYGVFNEGRLTLNDSSIADTGGLLNSGGVAVLRNSRVTGTYPRPYTYQGSGIQNRSGGTLVLRNSVLMGNFADFGGAGLDNSEDSSATLIDSVVSQNRISYEGVGGGIRNRGGPETMCSSASSGMTGCSVTAATTR